VPTGRLVVLGEPGAGKTILMGRLVLDLLARRADGGPVPSRLADVDRHHVCLS
jgi:GTPase SAR1 family protein